MKRYLTLILLVIILSNCKKDRSCNCTVSTTGTKTTRSQTAGVKIDFPPLPPVEISPAKDTTTTSHYSFTDTEIKSYNKVSKNTMRKNCAESFSQTYQDNSSNVIPGTSTVTTNDSGTKNHSCSID